MTSDAQPHESASNNPAPESASALDGATRPARVVDFDIPCLNCGYNLRGLSGDPVRCPECGGQNLLGEGEVPEELIAARLRKMETSAAVAVGAILFAIPWQYLLLSLLVEALHSNLGPNAINDMLSCLGVPAFAPLAIWLAAVGYFRASCLGERGWIRLLARYHVYGIGVGGAIIAAMIAIPAIWSPIGRGMRIANFVVPAIVVGGAIVGVRRMLVVPYRRLMVRIHELQRNAAIARIREETRQRIPPHQTTGG